MDILANKDQEFIDHTLLAPEYLVDLMEHSVFAKTADQVSHCAPNFAESKNAQILATDLHFNNSIYNFHNKDQQLQQTQQTVGNKNTNIDDSYGHERDSSLIALNADFLDTAAKNKNFCASEDVGKTLSLLADPNGLLDDTDILFSESKARKLLPHKKRISRKLKAPQLNFIEPNLPVPMQQQNLLPQPEKDNSSSMQFSCELCCHIASTQLEFYAHLKRHYEPTTPVQNLVDMKSSLDDLVPPKECNSICEFEKKTDGRVFNDVNLSFADFQNLEETVREAINQSSDTNSVHGADKCTSSDQTEATIDTDKNITEVEFSDSEDMLEGIRNVVYKVSIEDSCDDIVLMNSQDMQTTWLSNNFNDITSKPSFGDCSFAGSLFKTKPSADHLNETNSIKSLGESDLNSLETEHTQVPVYKHTSEKEETDEYDLKQEQLESTINKLKRTKKPKSVDEIKDKDFEHDIMNGKAEFDEEFLADDSDDIESFDEQLHEDEEHVIESIEDVHDENELIPKKKLYICKICERKFNSGNALKYHSRTHSGYRPHQCETCGNSFFALGALKTHMRLHTGDKPHECDQCKRCFRQYSELQYHITSIHSNEKRYQCEYCGKAFARKYSLVIHRRLHTKECNYKCDVCDKSFRASSYLMIHRRVHTGERPYPCEVCKKPFRVLGDLRRHQRIHERTKVDNDDNDNSPTKSKQRYVYRFIN